MNLVIDANVFAAFYQRHIIGIDALSLTACPIPIFEKLGKDEYCYFDENGFIKDEWSKLAEPEWFNTWYTDNLIAGNFLPVPVSNINAIRQKLQTLGFPTGVDIWYIKTSKSVYDEFGNVFLISEDLDFYAPKKKSTKHKERMEILANSSGNVSKYLNKKEKICVLSVLSYIEEFLN